MKAKLTITLLLTLMLSSCNKFDSTEEVKLIPVKSGENFEYVDRTGKIVINPQFSSASVFRDGIALVKTSGENAKWGYINEDGKYTINPTYVSATIFSEDLAWVVSENGAPTAINKDGETQFTLQEAQTVQVFKEGLAAFSKQDSVAEKWGFVDKSGKIKINPQFVSVTNFSDGKCGVKNTDGKCGYIDSSGKIVINYQFDAASKFKNEKAVVTLKDKVGVIDKNGRYLINPQYSDIYIDGDLFMVEQDKKWGWCDKDGKILINPQFEQAFPFNEEDLAAVKSGTTWGYINKEGKIAINPQFDSAFPFNNNLSLVSSSDKFGFINSEGKYLINPQFDNVSYDLLFYLYDGSSTFETVETDFFNISAITESVNIAAPEGLSINDNIAKILVKLNKSSEDLSKYSDNQAIYSANKISNDAVSAFHILGNPFHVVENGWSYERVYDANFIPNGVFYNIALTGKGSGKGKNVKEAFEKKLAAFTKVKSGFIDKDAVSVFKDKKRFIVIAAGDDNVVIYFININFDMTGYLARISESGSDVIEEEPIIEEAAPAVDSAATATEY